MLIVDRDLLDEGIANGAIGSDFQITRDEITYNFGNSGNKIFTGQIKNFSNLFKNQTNFNADIGYWNTSKATTMSRMFMNASSFNQDISSWELNNVTNINGMFQDSLVFNQDISSWNISKVTRLNSTFRGAAKFNQNLNSWDVSNVTRLDRTFLKAIKFNSDLNSWDVSKVVSMHRTFAGAKEFNGNISSWNTESLRSLRRTFDGAIAFNKDLSNWDVAEVTNFTRTFKNSTAFNQNLTSWNVEHYPQTPILFAPKLSINKKPCWGFNGCPSGINLISSNPSDNSFGVDTSLNLTLTFDKDIKASKTSGNISLYRSDATLVEYYSNDSLNISGKVITLPTELTANTDYYLLIDPKIIESSDGISYRGITDKTELNFSTFSNDSVAPVITSQSPENNATDVSSSDPTVEIIFSENIVRGSGNISLYNYSTDALIRSFNISNKTDISLSGNEMSISLRDSDGSVLINDGTQYYILIDEGAVVDEAASPNSFAGIKSKDIYNFTTKSFSCGSISGVVRYKNGNPVNGSTVKLYKDNSLINSTTTNSVGNYSFFPSSAGTFKVEFVKSEGKRGKGKVDLTDGPVSSGRFIKNIQISSSCEEFLDLDGLLIDPAGVIYESSTRQPVAGVTVKLLYEGSLVNNDWLDDSGGNNVQETGADGKYNFVLKGDVAQSGNYSITVDPPKGYGFESTKIISESGFFTPDLGGGAQNIQIQEDAPDSGELTTYYLNFNFTFTGVSSTSSNGVINNHIPIDSKGDPTLKPDVIGLAEAWTDASIRFSKAGLDSVNRRLDWLARNKRSNKKSYQGINLSFSNPILERVFNGSGKKFKDIESKDFENWARANWTDKRMKNESEEVFNDLKDNSVNIAFAELREKTFDPELNPKGGQLLGNWFLWTDGEIVVGNTKKNTTSSNQKSDALNLTFGADKKLKNNTLIGFSFTYGTDYIKIGSNGSNLNSENYSLSIYSSQKFKGFLHTDFQLGIGKMDFSTTRFENSIAHKGQRDANLLFGSFSIKPEPISRKNITFSPFAQIKASYISLEPFSESGSHLALTFKKQTINYKTLTFGSDLFSDFVVKEWKIKPFAKIEYNFNFTDDSIVNLNYLDDSTTNYRFSILNSSDNFLSNTIGLQMNRKNKFGAVLSYKNERGDSKKLDSYQLQINWNF
ncbi:hypothetical protein EV00_0783 [Prochlorococcus marinus str. MIT 9322]|uniref:Autotransporter domain-containing protein n=2 Tax=Prochlorococcaceae TaxID=2881426 RepID=A0A0A2B175_PROMR|nr:hypothetical protein EV00_0783 [Prochlorococcus marinus str. MIT 9322]KGG07843.1 hypothetical protein EV01_0921 [Prochlorococcus marinus str. MIT 9401]